MPKDSVRKLTGQTTVKSVTKCVEDILSWQFMSDIFNFQFENQGCWIEFNYALDENALVELKNTRLGKTILFTDREEHGTTEDYPGLQGPVAP